MVWDRRERCGDTRCGTFKIETVVAPTSLPSEARLESQDISLHTQLDRTHTALASNRTLICQRFSALVSPGDTSRSVTCLNWCRTLAPSLRSSLRTRLATLATSSTCVVSAQQLLLTCALRMLQTLCRAGCSSVESSSPVSAPCPLVFAPRSCLDPHMQQT